MLKKLLIAGLIVVGIVGAVVAGGAWMMFAANTPGFEGERSVKIPRGSGFVAATDSLDSAGVLGVRRTFVWMGRLTGWGGQIKAGHYTFEAGSSNYDILQKLRRGLQTPIRLTIPPGTRPEVVAAVAGRDMGDFDAPDFLAALRDPVVAASLGTDTTHLFGYMLPETYNFYWLTDAETVIRRIKEDFDSYFNADRQARAAAAGLSKDDVINLAGIVEWETGINDEKPRVAGVYLNRLRRRGWRLQADPTVQYAVMAREGQKRRLLNVDYGIRHPYNTYLIDGLPPGPITNPSKSSIDAVLNAEEHNYMFFVARGDGSHVFSRTLGEHNRAAAQYHALQRQRRQQAQDAAGSGE